MSSEDTELRKALLDAKVVATAILPGGEAEKDKLPIALQIDSAEGIFAIQDVMDSIERFVKGALDDDEEIRITLFIKRNNIIK